MSMVSATDKLPHFETDSGRQTGWLLPLVLRLEASLERRRTARTLYALDERSLSDIGLSRADVEAVNARARLTNPIPSM